MKLVLLHLFCFVLQEGLSQSLVDLHQRERIANNCTIKARHTERVNIGWPYVFSCGNLLSHYMKPPDYESYDPDSYPDDSTQKHNATCRILDLDNNRIIFDKTVVQGEDYGELIFNMEINASTSSNYSIEGWLSGLSKDCAAFDYQLEITEFENLTCQEAYQASKPTKQEGRKESLALLTCPVVKKGHISIPRNSTPVWFKNCNALSEGYSTSGLWNHQLELKKLSYGEHPGTYSCAVIYNGMTRFISHYQFCVKPPHRIVQHTITCSKEKYHATIGKDMVLECSGTIHISLSNSPMNSITWEKVSGGGNVLNCINKVDRPTTSENNERATCSYHKLLDENCYSHEPSAEEQDIQEQTFVMNLTIRNVEKGDLGTYKVTFRSVGSNSNVVSATVHLTEDTVPVLIGNAAAVGSSTIVFVAVLMMGVWLCWWKQVYFKVHYRRRFGECCQNNREYGAFFSYHFSYDLDKFAQNQVRDVTTFVRDELESQGYKIYDETKDNCEIAPRAEHQLSYMKQSHRVVIILTSEYVKDHWKVFTLQQGFEEMIRSESKLIFILVPGVKEYIKQHAVEDKTLDMIKTAMNVNYVIEWSNERKFNRKLFSLQLELAMPKLSSYKATRLTSTSSSVTSQVLYKNGFKRTFSNETGTTEIGSPVSVQEDYIEISEELAL